VQAGHTASLTPLYVANQESSGSTSALHGCIAAERAHPFTTFKANNSKPQPQQFAQTPHSNRVSITATTHIPRGQHPANTAGTYPRGQILCNTELNKMGHTLCCVSQLTSLPAIVVAMVGPYMRHQKVDSTVQKHVGSKGEVGGSSAVGHHGCQKPGSFYNTV